MKARNSIFLYALKIYSLFLLAKKTLANTIWFIYNNEMKYLYIKIMLLLIGIFDIIPGFLITFLFSINNKKFIEYLPKKNNEIVYSKNTLIWMDYSNAIGDFFIILKSIIKYDQLGKAYSVLVHKKFKGIIESLNLKNVEIIYKENSLGKHYLKETKNLTLSMDKITNEFRNKNLIFDKIFYFNGVLLSDALTALKEISYNELIMIAPRIFLRGENSRFIDKNFINLSLFYLSKKDQFKIKIINNDHYNEYSLEEIINDLFCLNDIKNNIQKYATKNYTVISAGASNKTKILRQDHLLKIVKEFACTNNKLFVGSDFDKKFIRDIMENRSREYNFKLNLELIELFNLVKYSNLVISYDTGLYHMANFLDKKTCLIINESDFAYKYMRKYWLGKVNKGNLRIVLKRKLFYK